MFLFITGIVLLIIGYFTYGRLIERIIAPDDRKTPAHTHRDGVDFLVMPHWKNMLIQLLNIAGVGPVIGVILGVKFGAIVFIIIPIGNIIAGATHDFIAGMMSVRHNGANLPYLVRITMGGKFYRFFSLFMVLLLLLVVAVFINIPASLIDGFFPDNSIFWFAVAGIFLYYIMATLFPVDKIIGKVYPVFGALLLFGTIAMFFGLMHYAIFTDPSVLSESESFRLQKWTGENGHPVVPLLFVTIACGIISGFHATQSPIIARTMAHEKQGKSAFYGMMVLEGIIAMVWAAAGLAIYNIFPKYFDLSATVVLRNITEFFLGTWMGGITVIAVVILAVTSGDTAMRSLRLSLAEMAGISQKSFKNRLLVCAPLIAVVVALLSWSNIDAKSFSHLWNYFAWGNQVLASSTLLASAVWLFRQRKNGFVAIVPGMFMLFIVLSYILWISPQNGGPIGFGMELFNAYFIAAILTVIIGAWTVKRGFSTRKENAKQALSTRIKDNLK